MASYTVTDPAFAAHAKALTASTVDTVTFAGGSNSGFRKRVEILIHTADAPVYVSVDGSTPTVAGGSTYVLLSGNKASFYPPDHAATVVKLISAGTTVTYSVTGFTNAI